MIFLIAIVILLALLILGVPVVWGFGTAIIIMSLYTGFSGTAAFNTVFGKISSVVLLAIPMFIMAGGVMEKGKIGDALINFVELFVGKVRGNLAIVATVTSAVFGSISGSGAATLSCIGSIMFPKMRERGYDMGKAGAVVCCAAPLGLLIPPSATQIIIGWLGNLSVLACFMSTVIPGLILTTLISVVSFFLFKNDPQIIENQRIAKQQHLTAKQAGQRTVTAIPALLMPVIILGSIYGGIMTPTEAAAVAVFYAVPVALFVYKGTNVKELSKTFVNTATSTGNLMVMISIMMIVSQILMMENVPSKVFALMTAVSENRYVIFLMINIFLILLGMVMDDTSGVMLVVTLLMPMAGDLGVSPYTLSAIIGVNMGMGNITPPTAPFLYMTSGIARVDTLKLMGPTLKILLFAYLPTLILTTYVPAVSTFLPHLVVGV